MYRREKRCLKWESPMNNYEFRDGTIRMKETWVVMEDEVGTTIETTEYRDYFY